MVGLGIGILGCNTADKSVPVVVKELPVQLYEYTDQSTPAWSSFENIDALKGAGGKENNGAKGHPFNKIRAGETQTLMYAKGPGIVNRMWMTISDRSPRMLRSLRIDMYWDGEEKPAVSVPFGDFFGLGLGRTKPYHNHLFANHEGRSFNFFIPMPFKTEARIDITNESDQDLDMAFFDINFQRLESWNNNFLYFHAFWHRDINTELAVDFEILPKVLGKGRFIGTNIGLNSNTDYKSHWWGEGEVKMYIDGDTNYASLVGTGTEDYIGTAYGQGEFFSAFQGCLIGEPENFQWAFYRYHIPDPIYFKTDIRVTIQQMGGSRKRNVIDLLAQGVNLIPVTVQNEDTIIHLYQPGQVNDLSDPNLMDGWTNYYRQDDLSATAYFYLDRPNSNLPELQAAEIRVVDLFVPE